eukprot:scaffold3131_cov112-Isochrysis_galbana.AAC.1
MRSENVVCFVMRGATAKSMLRASGPRMMAWIAYGGPGGAGALGLEGGALFSFYSHSTTR